MSSGKNIYAYSVSSIYHPNPEVFLGQLSKALASNLNVCFFDSTTNTNPDKKLYINNGFSEVLQINVDIDRNFEENYFIVIPVNHVEKELWIEFYPNDIISIFHIPFTSGWSFFIENILDKSSLYFGGRENYIKEMESVRNLYLPIFKKLKCDKIFLSSYFNQNWIDELVFENSYNEKITFDDILKCAREKDNIETFGLKSIFQGEYYDEIKTLYQENEYFRIAFIDEC